MLVNAHLLCCLTNIDYVHLDLLSFPTRRSSDLAGPVGAHPARLRDRRGLAAGPPGPAGRAAGARPRSRGAAQLAGPGARSEEHTSELQSPCNLVCRLLLEKKKNNSLMTRLQTPH